MTEVPASGLCTAEAGTRTTAASACTRARRCSHGDDAVSPVAIVTASDSGIGQESAKALAESGFDIGVTYKEDKDGAEETLAAVQAAGRRGEIRQQDLTNLPRAADVIDELAGSLGGLDVLVNNAGTGDPTADFLELSYEEWCQVIDTNLSGAFL